ncbi:MAG: polymer-forming cytoskeletal protein [Burkholderiaceae bacterium]|nr:polymer-forming cytoskeletal protein [Burkholderiaceae bacterium]
MADINSPGSLLVGEGVYMKGSMRVPGTASIDGKLEGDLTADTVIVQNNGSMDGRTTANHVRVAGQLNNTTIANKTLVIESSGRIAGSITYEELEIKKGGSLMGGIYKVGQAAPAPAPAAPRPAAAAPAAPAVPAAQAAAGRAPAAPAAAPAGAAAAPIAAQPADAAQPKA